ncbi:hypothetical protein EG327_010784 [Venturia inaequalis]|uniref:Uncharacterized protein n=1 Tax=Venturia inaequalis TaxID=5025 RepID=A0A8H3UGW2_VENIN|nr:hypothetical protein EG327_010784 [Venturia inaequalis]
MPFETFNIRAEDLNMSPLTSSRSAPAQPNFKSDRPSMSRSTTSKTSFRNLSSKTSIKTLSRKTSKPALKRKLTLEEIYSKPGLSRATTDASYGTAAMEVAPEVTLKSRVVGIWGTFSTYIFKAAITADALAALNYPPVMRGCVI